MMQAQSHRLRRIVAPTSSSAPSLGAKAVARGRAMAISAAEASSSASSSASSQRRRSLSSPARNQCNLNIVSSPFPPIDPPPYPPLYEFVTTDWSTLSSKTAILDGTTGQSRTFDDYFSLSSSVASSLKRDMDVHEESTVALFAPNHVDYAPISLGVSLTGSKLTPVNPLYKAGELSTVLERSRSSVLIAHDSVLDVALEAAKSVETVKHVVTIPTMDDDPVPDGTIPLNDLKGHPNPMTTTAKIVHGDVVSHPFLLPYSSGTTGLPKGVCLSHGNLVSNLMQLDEAEGMAFPTDHKLFSPLPFFHIYGYLASMLYCAWRGQQIVTLSGRFELERFCRLVEEHKPQRAHLVPPILIGLAKHPIVSNYDMSSLGMILCAAAPLGPDTEKAVIDRLGGTEVKQAWGMSELSPLGTINSDYNSKQGSVGQLVSSTFGKVVDPRSGKSLGPGETGELMIKGPQVMLGYLDAPDQTAECLSKDGWLHTGDVAHYDDDGFFYITDRLKELIKVRGYQVAPAELEALLLTNPHVADAAVVPVADEVSGELPRAYVVLKAGEDGSRPNKTEHEIRDWVKDRVAPYKRLEGGVLFVEEIPKSASGKILRRILRDLAAEEGRTVRQ